MAEVTDGSGEAGRRKQRPEGAVVRETSDDEYKAMIKLALIIVLVVGGLFAANLTPLAPTFGRQGIGRAIEWLRASEAAPALYMVIYAAASALAIPGSILTLAGGAMFGVFWGTIYTTVAANIGATAGFVIARFLGRDGIRRLAGSRLDALDRATSDYGFRGLLTLRLIPVVPFNALNFGAGLTSIGWRPYALATAIGIFPGTVVYTMFADALLAGSQEASREALARVLVSGALLILLSFLPTIARRLGVSLPGASTSAGAVLLTAAATGWVAVPIAAQSALPSHEIIRPTFQEPRIHFAVNCAAPSCPVLWPEAFAVARLDEQLDRAVRALIGDRRHFDVGDSVVRMNEALDWYRDDFGGVDGLRSFFAPYPSPEAAAVLTDPTAEGSFVEYDWTLNDVAR